ncbi:MAG: hypothetical protein CM1200mP18_10830 [Gammaproteobacteria bacterium]|nr:MAG: hypothetical protein CM1200mP18_10830 [Gammaproteobacteria bacterium]
MSSAPRNNLLGLLARHPVAANLMMAMMIIAGIWGLSKLNAQFFPNFDIDFVSVKVVWVGASAEDVEKLVTEPLEQQLRGIDRSKELRSRSVDGLSLVTLEFKEGTDMGLAIDQVKEQVDLVRNLPATAEPPEIGRIINYEPIASVLIAGPNDPVVYVTSYDVLKVNCLNEESRIFEFSDYRKRKSRFRYPQKRCASWVYRWRILAGGSVQHHVIYQ